MMVMSFPLLVRAARVAFEEVNPRLEQIARTLGASDARVFFTITLPLAARGILGGMLLAFARAIGEFGATILVAGNIPGRTTTLSLAIYNLVQLGRDDEAFRLLGISLVVIASPRSWIARGVPAGRRAMSVCAASDVVAAARALHARGLARAERAHDGAVRPVGRGKNVAARSDRRAAQAARGTRRAARPRRHAPPAAPSGASATCHRTTRCSRI